MTVQSTATVQALLDCQSVVKSCREPASKKMPKLTEYLQTAVLPNTSASLKTHFANGRREGKSQCNEILPMDIGYLNAVT